MLFTTDQQTIQDLNIFGRQGSASIYAMFNRSATRGGATLLEEMFRYPLSDAGAINKRSRLMKYFSDQPVFPFDSELFDIAEQYLDTRDERTKLASDGDTMVKRLGGLIAEKPEFKFVQIGVNAILSLIANLQQFLKSIDFQEVPFYQQESESISLLLSTGEMNIVPKNGRKLSYAKLAELDILLRFQNRDVLKKMLRYIYQADVYIAVGRVALEQGFIFPLAVTGSQQNLNIQGLYHPQLKGAVPNDISLNTEGNVVFLTGANMAGKSTFMKSLGTAMYLAHMGFPVAATKMEFSVMEGIYTTINLPDNLGAGASHFYAEVLRVKKIAKELAIGKHLFVIVDELFRGTNVKDAYEATLAVTTGFAQRRNSTFIISTHIIETAEVLKAIPNISFKYLPTKMKNNEPVYTYTLAEGVTDDRHGMVIINNEGIIQMLLKGKEQVL